MVKRGAARRRHAAIRRCQAAAIIGLFDHESQIANNESADPRQEDISRLLQSRWSWADTRSNGGHANCFVSAEHATQALNHFLEHGKQDPALEWVRIDAFPRETLWGGRAQRKARERADPRKG